MHFTEKVISWIFKLFEMRDNIKLSAASGRQSSLEIHTG